MSIDPEEVRQNDEEKFCGSSEELFYQEKLAL